MDEKEIYAKALKTWGEAQIDMVFEEMAELQKELCKALRGKGQTEAIAEEIADVEIMLGQMKLHFGVDGDVENYKDGKLERLKNRMEKQSE